MAKEILEIILSWPTVVIIAVVILRKPLGQLVERLINSDTGKAKVGPLEIELGKLAKEGHLAVDQLNRINYLMAESRLLELEITEGTFGNVFSNEQRNKMKSHIEELKKLTEYKISNKGK